METAVLQQENVPGLAPGTNLYTLSAPFNGHDHVAISDGPLGTTVIPATEVGTYAADPNGLGVIAHRTWYPSVGHDQALAELGYQTS